MLAPTNPTVTRKLKDDVITNWKQVTVHYHIEGAVNSSAQSVYYYLWYPIDPENVLNR